MSAVETTKPDAAEAAPAPSTTSALAGGPARLGLRRRGTSMLGTVLPPLVVFLIVLGIWALISEVLLADDKRFLFPPFWDVWNIGLADSQNRAELLDGVWLTGKAAMVGLFLSIVIGVGTAVLMSQARWIERSIYPYAVVLQTIPVLALVPLVGFVFGFDFSSRVLVVVLISLFPIITNTLFGLLSAEQAQHDLLTLHRASRVTRLMKLQFPAAMPAIFAGLRIAAGASVIGAVVGDFFFKQGEPGIGRLIDSYSTRLESERLYAAVILSSLLGIAVFLAVGFLQNRVVGRWHTSTRHGGG